LVSSIAMENGLLDIKPPEGSMSDTQNDFNKFALVREQQLKQDIALLGAADRKAMSERDASFERANQEISLQKQITHEKRVVAESVTMLRESERNSRPYNYKDMPNHTRRTPQQEEAAAERFLNAAHRRVELRDRQEAMHREDRHFKD